VRDKKDIGERKNQKCTFTKKRETIQIDLRSHYPERRAARSQQRKQRKRKIMREREREIVERGRIKNTLVQKKREK
jgi:hypothetical protein